MQTPGQGSCYPSVPPSSDPQRKTRKSLRRSTVLATDLFTSLLQLHACVCVHNDYVSIRHVRMCGGVHMCRSSVIVYTDIQSCGQLRMAITLQQLNEACHPHTSSQTNNTNRLSSNKRPLHPTTVGCLTRGWLDLSRFQRVLLPWPAEVGGDLAQS